MEDLNPRPLGSTEKYILLEYFLFSGKLPKNT
jgi:hypothetical protein